jgi:hypothetical protein
MLEFFTLLSWQVTGLAIAGWLILAFLISLNGFIGQQFIAPWLGSYGNHIYKSVVAIALIAIVAGLVMTQVATTHWLLTAIDMGGFWLLLTVSFEFLAGHYLFGNSWEALLADYRFWQGRLWVLVLLMTAIAPALMGWLLGVLSFKV